jgi:DNA-3-methyladenine glycosylase I
MTKHIHRCSWANPNNPRYIAYHDEEWGVPCHDELRLFEMLNLEGAQAGLSWETVLNKRDTYRAAFDHWDAEKIAAYGPDKVAELLANPGIIRNRLKVAAAIANAQAYLRLRAEGSSLDHYLWAWVDGKPIVNHVASQEDRAAKTALSDRISAYMQGIGMVNDHDAACFRHAACQQ